MSTLKQHASVATTAAVPKPDDVPPRAGHVDESAMRRRLEWLCRSSEADPRAARLRGWVLDYWRERQ